MSLVLFQAQLGTRTKLLRDMTFCVWPRQHGWISHLRDWWTPPMQSVGTNRPAEVTGRSQKLLQIVSYGGIWLS
ncbi:hypothetical protein OMCYN_01842 [cyanobiont of Ornithocercus magnificus]|nr:hypothetical protein OMCYN_01842 [cyanobiont of Ornithocercus magnificus]